MNRRRIRCISVLGIVAVFCALLALSMPARAQECPDGICATDAPTPTPTDDGSNPGQIIRQIITNITEYVLRFPVEQMFTAINQITGRYLYEAYAGLGATLGDTLNALLFGEYSIGWMRDRGATPFLAAPLFGVIAPFWEVSWTMARILLTATLALTLVSAMRHGLTSIFTAQEFKEALFGWIQSAVLAWASLYILELAYWLSTAGAAWLLGQSVKGEDVVGVFFQAGPMLTWLGIGAIITAPAFSSFAIVILFLSLVIGFVFVLFMGVSLAAFIAGVFMLAVIAPIAFTVSSVPDLGYLRALFVRGAGMVLIMPLVDAALLAATIRLAAQPVDGLAPFLMRVWIAAGLISALVTVNGWLIQQIFAGLQQAVGTVKGAVTGLVGAALVAASPFVDGVLPGAGQLLHGAGGALVGSSWSSDGGSGGGVSSEAPRTGSGSGSTDGSGSTGAPVGSDSAGEDKDVASRAGAVTTDDVRQAVASRRQSASLRQLGGRLLTASGMPGGREAGLLADWSARHQDQDAQRLEHQAERDDQHADQLAQRRMRGDEQTRREAEQHARDEIQGLDRRHGDARRLAAILSRHFPDAANVAVHLERHLAAVEQNAALSPADRARAVTRLHDIVQDEWQSPERFAEQFAVWAETYPTGSHPDATRTEMLGHLTARLPGSPRALANGSDRSPRSTQANGSTAARSSRLESSGADEPARGR